MPTPPADDHPPSDSERSTSSPVKKAVSVIAAVVGVALVAFGVVDANNSTAGASARSALTLIAPPMPAVVGTVRPAKHSRLCAAKASSTTRRSSMSPVPAAPSASASSAR